MEGRDIWAAYLRWYNHERVVGESFITNHQFRNQTWEQFLKLLGADLSIEFLNTEFLMKNKEACRIIAILLSPHFETFLKARRLAKKGNSNGEDKTL